METKAKWVPDAKITQIIKLLYLTLLWQVGLNNKSGTQSSLSSKIQSSFLFLEEWKNSGGNKLPKIS